MSKNTAWHNPIYTITNNIIDQNDPDMVPLVDEPLPDHTLSFRLKDDDGEVYFEGKMIKTDDERLFEPLDRLGSGYGCTSIEIRTKKGWEIV